MRSIILVLCLYLLQSCFAGQFLDFPYAGRANKLYVPTLAGLRDLPLFVMLHGCTQNSTDFATGTRMNWYAETYNFYVLYPDQPASANAAECWNWFLPEDQARGSGEPALIVAMADQVKQQHRVNSDKVFVAGISAGAAMADILGATYPDYFSGVCVASGLAYKSATNVTYALEIMAYGPAPNAYIASGLEAYQAMGPRARVFPLLVTHGTADDVVNPANAADVVASYVKTFDLVLGHGEEHGWITDTPTATIPGQVPGGHSYTVQTYADRLTGEVLIVSITVNGMNHAWSGGSAAGTYTDPEGPNASAILVNWFLFNNFQIL